MWDQDASTGGLGRVTLQRYANLATSFRVSDVGSPGYRALRARLRAASG